MGLPARLPSEADAIVDAYLAKARGNPMDALRLVIRDALADLCESERRSREQRRLISYGYARGTFDQG
ncbi:hypothetical protein GGR33_004273 [Methylobacterium brachythecii]|uniref:Uncharacterized protein n=1 Tax=Methylobacterium brachythecii TaxID=1176177 RepID=A0A7W6AJW7_9HYPH|nr:hypothetical protein [Methylobacterium brachythecii]MBB3904750.1 hypothetical protein [Methylobacterium brachythecii]GLS45574.1 hypothetical protein GCM10007884_35650 [Methylobacterium brachythecii]